MRHSIIGASTHPFDTHTIYSYKVGIRDKTTTNEKGRIDKHRGLGHEEDWTEGKGEHVEARSDRIGIEGEWK